MTLKSSYKKYKSFKPPFPFANPFLATVLSKLRIHLHKKAVNEVTNNTIKEVLPAPMALDYQCINLPKAAKHFFLFQAIFPVKTLLICSPHWCIFITRGGTLFALIQLIMVTACHLTKKFLMLCSTHLWLNALSITSMKRIPML